jgi:hypothetical protein
MMSQQQTDVIENDTLQKTKYKTRQSRKTNLQKKTYIQPDAKKQASILQYLSVKPKRDNTVNQTISSDVVIDNSEKVSFKTNTQILSEQEKFVLKELNKFYTRDKIERIKPIINQESDTSLRLIDWTLTNHSKKNCIVIKKKDGTMVEIYPSYKAHLDSYPKNTLFDVFKRGSCIRFYYSDNEEDYIITSVKQLNIFRWLIKDEILDYIETNRTAIVDDMRVSLRRSAINKKKKGKHKAQRQELSSSAYKQCFRQSYKTTVSL